MFLLSFFVILVEQNAFVQILKCFSFCLCIGNNVSISNLVIEVVVRNVVRVPKNSL